MACFTTVGDGNQTLAEPNMGDPSSNSVLPGLASGSCSTFLLYPLDLIKVRLQVTENNFKRTVRKTLPTDAPRSTASKAWRWVVWNSPFLRQGGMIVKNENDFRASAGRKPGYGWLASSVPRLGA